MTIDPAKMTTTALWCRLQLCPDRAELWTDHEHAVRDEFDRRVLEQERAA